MRNQMGLSTEFPLPPSTDKSPCTKELEFLAHMAQYSPSGDNCQPFQLIWDNNILRVTHSEDLAKHALNNRNHASILAFGCLLESLDIAASHLSLALQVHFWPPSGTAKDVWAEIHLHRQPRMPDGLVHQIPLRYTDRRTYRKGPLPTQSLKSEIGFTSPLDLADLHMGPVDGADLRDYILRSEEYMWHNPQAYRDLFAWLRLTGAEQQQHQDGMSSGNVGVKTPELPFFLFLRRFPHLVPKLWPLGLKAQIRKMTKTALDSSAGLILFSAKDMQRSSLVQVGRLAFRSWLKLNQLGYAVQPLTVPALSIYDGLHKAFHAEMPQEFRELFSQGKQILSQHFGLTGDQVPVWMFRTGLAPLEAFAHRTPRRPLSDFLILNSVTEKKVAAATA